MKYLLLVIALISPSANALLIQLEIEESGEIYSASFNADTESPRVVEGSPAWGMTDYEAGPITNFSTNYTPLIGLELTSSMLYFIRFGPSPSHMEMVMTLTFGHVRVSGQIMTGGPVSFDSPNPLADFISHGVTLPLYFDDNIFDSAHPKYKGGITMTATVPEPATIALMSLGLICFATRRRIV